VFFGNKWKAKKVLDWGTFIYGSAMLLVIRYIFKIGMLSLLKRILRNWFDNNCIFRIAKAERIEMMRIISYKEDS